MSDQGLNIISIIFFIVQFLYNKWKEEGWLWDNTRRSLDSLQNVVDFVMTKCQSSHCYSKASRVKQKTKQPKKKKKNHFPASLNLWFLVSSCPLGWPAATNYRGLVCVRPGIRVNGPVQFSVPGVHSGWQDREKSEQLNCHELGWQGQKRPLICFLVRWVTVKNRFFADLGCWTSRPQINFLRALQPPTCTRESRRAHPRSRDSRGGPSATP